MRVDSKGGELVTGASAVATVGVSSTELLTKKSRRRQKKSAPMPTAVMRLFRACRDVFTNCRGGWIVPSPEEVERIQSVIDKIKPTDVNVTPNMFRNVKPINGKIPVTYLHLYECDKFSIGIFCLPPSAVIPLHNHPEMTVFSKILFGSVHIKSYDWVDIPEEPNDSIDSTHFQPPGVRLAKVKTDDVFTAPCPPSILYPTSGGNMHCFSAVTSCAVLDVLGPPYSDAEGRHCTYYNVFPYDGFSDDTHKLSPDGEEYAWLEAREKPEDFYVVGAKYTGPKIVDH